MMWLTARSSIYYYYSECLRLPFIYINKYIQIASTDVINYRVAQCVAICTSKRSFICFVFMCIMHGHDANESCWRLPMERAVFFLPSSTHRFLSEYYLCWHTSLRFDDVPLICDTLKSFQPHVKVHIQHTHTLIQLKYHLKLFQASICLSVAAFATNKYL